LEKDSRIEEVMADIPGDKPDVFVLPDDEFVLFASTGKQGAVFLSSGLVEALDRDQLEVALAHEMAHISRSKRPSILVIFLLRVFMFFNPVVLMEFRKVVQEEEKICDDIAVAMTHKPLALAATLKKLYQNSQEDEGGEAAGVSTSIEAYSQRLLIGKRIERLEQGRVRLLSSM
jgi:Zn-dependent protease with chaperone function